MLALSILVHNQLSSHRRNLRHRRTLRDLHRAADLSTGVIIPAEIIAILNAVRPKITSVLEIWADIFGNFLLFNFILESWAESLTNYIAKPEL